MRPSHITYYNNKQYHKNAIKLNSSKHIYTFHDKLITNYSKFDITVSYMKNNVCIREYCLID